MKISYLSDIHADHHVPFNPNQLKWEKRTKEFIIKLIETDEGEHDVLCLGGDYSHYNVQTMWCLEVFSQYYNQVMLQIGNHDLYLISKNQVDKYNGHSQHRINELYMKSVELRNVHPLFTDKTFTYKGITFGGNPLWYPLETIEQQMFFSNVSNDSKYIKGFNVKEQHHQSIRDYESLLTKNVDVMISHVPVINIDSHFRYNSTSCYLTPVKDINVKHWIMAHSHEQKVYEKPYCTFYMNALGYPDEKGLDLSIKSFII